MKLQRLVVLAMMTSAACGDLRQASWPDAGRQELDAFVAPPDPGDDSSVDPLDGGVVIPLDASESPDAGPPGCSGGRTLCGELCVSTSDDPRHCGSCGRACAGGETCAAGECQRAQNCGLQPCTGMTYCDLTTGQCRPGCASDDQCAGTADHCDLDRRECVCDAGFHLCGGACVSSASVSSCGSSCTPCPAPAGGSATCTTGLCGMSCPSSTRLCGGACLALDSPMGCGASCTRCTAPANASAICVSGACDWVCNAGYHECGGACVPNDSPSSCGTSCTPCSNPANGRAICSAGTCGAACDPGYHACGSQCVSNASPSSCGSSCTPCPAPANGTATCAAGACGFTCASGYHACGSSCVPNDSIDSCGSRCSPCPAGANATATCTAGACGLICNRGTQLCGGACVSTQFDDAHCGTCGNACGAGRSCSRGACVPRCASGYGLGPIVELPGALGEATMGNRLALADVDGDRRLDVVALDSLSSTATTGLVHVYLGNGDGTFRPRTSHASGLAPSALAVADVNGDGRADALVGAQSAPARVAAMLGRADGTLGAPMLAMGTGASDGSTSLRQRTLAVGDFDASGTIDLVIGSGVSLTSFVEGMLGSGNGTFVAQAVSSTRGRGTAMPLPFAVLDADGDGALDLVYQRDTAESLAVQRGNGDGTFRAPMVSAASTTVNQVTVGDFDEDGLLDVIGGGYGTGVCFFRAQRDGTFAASSCTAFGAAGWSPVDVADFDGDGHLDVATGFNGGPSGQLVLLLGDGTGRFPRRSTFSAAVTAVAAGDLDGDGRPDVVFTDGLANTVRVMLGRCG